MAEWSNAAVLKTVEGHTSGGSNPSFSAKSCSETGTAFFFDLFTRYTSQKSIEGGMDFKSGLHPPKK